MNVTKSEMAALEARDALHAWMFDAGCSEAVIADALIVVNELVTNAVMHADSDSVVMAVLEDMRTATRGPRQRPHGAGPGRADQRTADSASPSSPHCVTPGAGNPPATANGSGRKRSVDPHPIG